MYVEDSKPNLIAHHTKVAIMIIQNILSFLKSIKSKYHHFTSIIFYQYTPQHNCILYKEKNAILYQLYLYLQ